MRAKIGEERERKEGRQGVTTSSSLFVFTYLYGYVTRILVAPSRICYLQNFCSISIYLSL